MRAIRSHRPRLALWWAYLVVGGCSLLAFNLLATGSLAQSLLYDLVGASAVAVALVGVRRNDPDRHLPWLLMAAGQGLFGTQRWAARGPTVSRPSVIGSPGSMLPGTGPV